MTSHVMASGVQSINFKYNERGGYCFSVTDTGGVTTVADLDDPGNYWQIPHALGLVSGNRKDQGVGSIHLLTHVVVIEKLEVIASKTLPLHLAVAEMIDIGLIQAETVCGLAKPTLTQYTRTMIGLTFGPNEDEELLGRWGITCGVVEALALEHFKGKPPFRGNLALERAVRVRVDELEFRAKFERGEVPPAVKVEVSEVGKGENMMRVATITFLDGQSHTLRLVFENYLHFIELLGFVDAVKATDKEVKEEDIKLDLQGLPLHKAVVEIIVASFKIAQLHKFEIPDFIHFGRRLLELFSFGKVVDKEILDSLKPNSQHWVDLFVEEVLEGKKPIMGNSNLKGRVDAEVAKRAARQKKKAAAVALPQPLSKKQVQRLDNEGIEGLSTGFYGHLAERQLAWVPVAKFGFLTSEQLAKLTPEQIGSIGDATLINMPKFPNPQVQYVKDELVGELSKEKIQHLSPRQKALLTPAQRELLPKKKVTKPSPPPPASVHRQMPKAPSPITFWTMQWADWGRATIWQKAFFLFIVTPYRLIFG